MMVDRSRHWRPKTPEERRRAVRFRWTEDRVALLERLYPDTPNAAIADLFGVPLPVIANRARRTGLSKDPAFVKAQPYRFQAGVENANSVPVELREVFLLHRRLRRLIKDRA